MAMTKQDLPVVIGVDETLTSHAALRWAVQEAAARHAALQIVCAYQSPPALAHDAYIDASTWDFRQVAHAAQSAAAQAADYVRPLEDSVAVSGWVREGNPVPVLLAESAQAQLLVVGSRRYEGIHGVVLGSVSSAVAARAACPVVVVCGPAAPRDEGAAVVAGIQPGDSNEPVLGFAFEYAAVHRLSLHAVLCWHPDPLHEMAWRGQPAAPDRIRAWLSESLAGWREKYPEVKVVAAVEREHPVPGLVGAATAQHLLVVGRRGHHALIGTLLGSVSQGVLHHATCPVAVIPAT
jgi:nucleotide-binding universal stress UspA family protein